jgi:hypothetical protein
MTLTVDAYDEKDRRRMKNHDRKIAVSIAAFAAIKLKDANGNINVEIWEPYITDPEKQCGNLMNQTSIEGFMKSMLQQQIEKNMPMLMECSNHDTICKWIVEYAGQWEKAYREPRNKSYDISLTVLSVMSEAVAHMSRHFVNRSLDEKKIKMHFERVLATEHQGIIDDDQSPYLPVDEAVTRFYFRHKPCAQHMIMIAGKMWQKREVCNRGGSYSTKVQRNDITRQLDNAEVKFKRMLRERVDFKLPTKDEDWKLLALDHKWKYSREKEYTK